MNNYEPEVDQQTKVKDIIEIIHEENGEWLGHFARGTQHMNKKAD